MKNSKKLLLTALAIVFAGGSMMAWGGYYGRGWGGGWGWGGPYYGGYGYSPIADVALTGAVLASASNRPESPEESERRDNADQRKHLSRQIDTSRKEISKKRKKIEQLRKRGGSKSEIIDLETDIKNAQDNIKDLQSELGSV